VEAIAGDIITDKELCALSLQALEDLAYRRIDVRTCNAITAVVRNLLKTVELRHRYGRLELR
jgi:hypothetical protein